MEKALLNQVATSSFCISGITPQMLREAATLLEVEEKKAFPGSTIMIKLATSITLVYEPSISVSKFLSRNGNSVDLSSEMPNNLLTKNAAV